MVDNPNPLIKADGTVDADKIYFIAPRKSRIVVLPDGEFYIEWTESVEQWLKRCAVITGIKKPDRL